MPYLSIIIPTRNRSAELARTLSLLRSQRLPRHEIIVADNGSDDDTAAMVARRFPRVRLLRLGRNAGCAARNWAAGEARARFLLMLDDDSAPEPGAPAAAVGLLEAERRLAAVGFRVLLPDGRHEPGGTQHVFVGCAAAIRREAFLAAGGYPEDFVYYAEEYALCYRFFAMGLAVQVCSDLVARHRKVDFPARRAEVYSRLAVNNLRLVARFLPRPEAARRSGELARWYLNLARADGVSGPVAVAVRRARAELRRQPVKRETLHGRALEAATFRRGLAARFRELRSSGLREIGFWRYTKDARTFLEAAREERLVVRELGTDMLASSSFAGLGVVHPGAVNRNLLWIIPTFSPGLGANGSAELKARGLAGKAFFPYMSSRSM